MTPELEPRRIELRAGRPASVTFRHATARIPGHEMLVFPGLGRLVTLPADGEVTVDFPGLSPGEYSFCFGDGSPCGTLVVTDDLRHP